MKTVFGSQEFARSYEFFTAILPRELRPLSDPIGLCEPSKYLKKKGILFFFALAQMAGHIVSQDHHLFTAKDDDGHR